MIINKVELINLELSYDYQKALNDLVDFTDSKSMPNLGQHLEKIQVTINFSGEDIIGFFRYFNRSGPETVFYISICIHPTLNFKDNFGLYLTQETYLHGIDHTYLKGLEYVD